MHTQTPAYPGLPRTSLVSTPRDPHPQDPSVPTCPYLVPLPRAPASYPIYWEYHRLSHKWFCQEICVKVIVIWAMWNNMIQTQIFSIFPEVWDCPCRLYCLLFWIALAFPSGRMLSHPSSLPIIVFLFNFRNWFILGISPLKDIVCRYVSRFSEGSDRDCEAEIFQRCRSH